MRAAGRRVAPAAVRRRTSGLVEHTRWLFCVAALVSYLLTAPAALNGATPPTALLLAAGTVALFLSWIRRYWTQRAPLPLDLLDALAIGAFAVACPVPAAAYAFVFAALWFRALYGTTRRVYLYCVLVATGFGAAVPVWGLLPGRVEPVRAAEVFGSLPVMFVTVVVARHLALSLFAREQTRQRDAALAALGTRLLGVTDPDAIYRHAWDTTGRICAATPGLRVLAAVPTEDELLVVGHWGSFVEAPGRLPVATLPAGAPGQAGPPADAAPLSAAAGIRGEWLALPLPGRSQGWLLLGAPGAIPDEGAVAVRSMINQVALAMLTSEAHVDLTAQATTDPLTGLANRAAFTSALAQAVASTGHHGRAAVPRPGRLQAGQRRLRAPGRRRTAAPGGRADRRQRPGRRPVRAAGRRRVRGAAARSLRADRRGPGGAAGGTGGRRRSRSRTARRASG